MGNELEKGTSAWNVAQGYTSFKILKPLVELDKLVLMSIYGAEAIEESLGLPEDMKIKARIEAIRRLADELSLIIENSSFACRKEKEEIKKLRKRVADVNKVLKGIQKIDKDQRNRVSVVKINESHFSVCLSHLRDIKEKINIPLNNNSLIFQSSDEIDLDKLKQQFSEGGR